MERAEDWEKVDRVSVCWLPGPAIARIMPGRAAPLTGCNGAWDCRMVTDKAAHGSVIDRSRARGTGRSTSRRGCLAPFTSASTRSPAMKPVEIRSKPMFVCIRIEQAQPARSPTFAPSPGSGFHAGTAASGRSAGRVSAGRGAIRGSGASETGG